MGAASWHSPLSSGSVGSWAGGVGARLVFRPPDTHDVSQVRLQGRHQAARQLQVYLSPGVFSHFDQERVEDKGVVGGAHGLRLEQKASARH